MAKIKKPQKPTRKFNEPQVAAHICKLFGIPKREFVSEALVFASASESSEKVPWSMEAVQAYPWVTNVPQTIYGCSLSDDLIAHLTCYPDDVFLVYDEAHSGVDTLWLVLAETALSPDNSLSFVLSHCAPRLMANHVKVGEELMAVIAIQLSTCFRHNQ